MTTAETTVETPKPTEFELHLWANSKFPQQFGKRVKALKGRYSSCRGDQNTRFVHIPIETVEGQQLVNEIIKDNGNFFTNKPKTTVVLRGGDDFLGLPANCVVIDIPPHAEDPFKWTMSHFDLYMQNYFREYPGQAINYKKRLEERAEQKRIASLPEKERRLLFMDDKTKALLVIASCPHIRAYLNAMDPAALAQVEQALGQDKPTPETFPQTFVGDAKLVPDKTKYNIEKALNSFLPKRFKPEHFSKLVHERPEGGDFVEYIVIGDLGDDRAAYLVKTHAPFPKYPDNCDVVQVNEIKVDRIY